MKLKHYTVVKKQSFGTLRKYEKIDRKRDAQSHPKWFKMQAFGDLGLDFWDFGRLSKIQFIGWFFISKKLTNNLQKCDLGRIVNLAWIQAPGFARARPGKPGAADLRAPPYPPTPKHGACRKMFKIQTSNSMFLRHNDIDTPRTPETEPNKQKQTSRTKANQRSV